MLHKKLNLFDFKSFSSWRDKCAGFSVRARAYNVFAFTIKLHRRFIYVLHTEAPMASRGIISVSNSVIYAVLGDLSYNIAT